MRDVCSQSTHDQKSEELEHRCVGHEVLLLDQVLEMQEPNRHFDFFVLLGHFESQVSIDKSLFLVTEVS